MTWFGGCSATRSCEMCCKVSEKMYFSRKVLERDHLKLKPSQERAVQHHVGALVIPIGVLIAVTRDHGALSIVVKVTG